MTAPDFIGKPDYDVQIEELDRRIDDKRWEQFEVLLKMIEHQISVGRPPAEAIACAREIIAAVRRLPL